MKIQKKSIKEIIESKSQREKLKLTRNQIVDLLIETGDTEYIKSVIEDEKMREKLGLEFLNPLRLIMATGDSEYIKSFIENKAKRDEYGINSYLLLRLMKFTGDFDYIKSCISKRNQLNLELIDILKLLPREKITELLNEEGINYEYKRKIKLPEDMTFGIEIESEGACFEIIDKDIIDKNWSVERRC